jgi:hypothetical protein
MESETAGSPAKTRAMRRFWASCRSMRGVVPHERVPRRSHKRGEACEELDRRHDVVGAAAACILDPVRHAAIAQHAQPIPGEARAGAVPDEARSSNIVVGVDAAMEIARSYHEAITCLGDVVPAPTRRRRQGDRPAARRRPGARCARRRGRRPRPPPEPRRGARRAGARGGSGSSVMWLRGLLKCHRRARTVDPGSMRPPDFSANLPRPTRRARPIRF